MVQRCTGHQLIQNVDNALRKHRIRHSISHAIERRVPAKKNHDMSVASVYRLAAERFSGRMQAWKDNDFPFHCPEVELHARVLWVVSR